MLKCFVPADAGARSVGADGVAAALAAEAARRDLEMALTRTGSRGLYWLEPLVEVERDGQRLGYGPLTPAGVPGLMDALLAGTDHPLALGEVTRLPYLARQTRLACARLGETDPLSLADYRARGGFAGLEKAREMAPQDIVAAVETSGLRGRGGAGFPAGIKWRTVAGAPGPRKYVVCNADEGDSGTFSDRMLMEGDPYCLIEGMLIAALAVGAGTGYIYLRSEYPDAWRVLAEAIQQATAAGILGTDALGPGRDFELILFKGAGAYVCGEETALLESIEGKRGLVRAKPPLPALQGLFGRPTLVNNVITLGSVPWILAHGGEAYREYGVGRSRGTLPFQLAGNLKYPGLVEVPFGVLLGELLYDYGGGSASGRPLKAVQVGGPLGAWIPESRFDLPLDYEAFTAAGATVGHGGIVAVDDTADMAALARHAMAFCAHESCGKCVPCRIGSTRGVELLDAMGAKAGTKAAEEALLRDLCQTLVEGSLCALGGMTPYPVLSALDHFPADFGLKQENRT